MIEQLTSILKTYIVNAFNELKIKLYSGNRFTVQNRNRTGHGKLFSKSFETKNDPVIGP